MIRQLLAVPPLVRDAATALADTLGQGGLVAAYTWQQTAADLGRHYGWPWWNTLITSGARGGVDGPATWAAATDELWRLVGQLDDGTQVEWLKPVTRRLRFAAADGTELAPGEFPPAGRVMVRETVTGIEPAAMTLRRVAAEATGARSLAASVVDAAAPAAQAAYLFSSDPVGVIASLAARLWRQGGPAVPSAALTCLGVAGAVEGWQDRDELVATAAAAGFLAAHGQTLPPAQLPVPADAGIEDWPELLVALDLVAQTIRLLLDVIRPAAHLGGWIKWRIQPSQPALPFAAHR